MKILIDIRAAIELEMAVASTPNEFSGFGFVERMHDYLFIYKVIVAAGGSWGYTEINTDTLAALSQLEDKANAKVWLHRHPVGNGVPGPHNWSGTDNNTILTNPLGGIPEIVGWSASIVRTPRGWVGRIDNHIQKTTAHVEVLSPVFDLVKRIQTSKPRKAEYDQWDYEDGYVDALCHIHKVQLKDIMIEPDGSAYIKGLFGRKHVAPKNTFKMLGDEIEYADWEEK